jgi:two-component system, response regulator PdtaR
MRSSAEPGACVRPAKSRPLSSQAAVLPVLESRGHMHDVAQQSERGVLVVEDDTILRLQTVLMIERAGYNVVEACNADEAIAILEMREDIRIVVTDIEMPGSMDGIKLARAIRDRWPPVELIVTSGRHRVLTDELPLRVKFMPKPYAPEVLITAIRTLHP